MKSNKRTFFALILLLLVLLSFKVMVFGVALFFTIVASLNLMLRLIPLEEIKRGINNGDE